MTPEATARRDAARDILGYGLAAGAAALWGLAGIFAKAIFNRGVPAAELAEVRIGLGALFFVVVITLARRRAVRVRLAHLPLLVLFGVVGLGGVQLAYYEAVKRLPVALAVLIQYIAPLLMLLFFWTRGRRVGRPLWIASLITLAGCYLAVGAYDADLLQVNVEGAAIALLSAVIFAFYLLLAERIVRAYSAYTLLLYGFLFAALAWTVARPWWTLPWSTWDAGIYALIAGVAVLGTFVPFLLSSLALGILPPTRVGLTQTLEPVVAGIAAFAFLHESLEPAQLLGAAGVLAGIALARSVQPTVDGV